MISTGAWAKKIKVTARHARFLCKSGRVCGAVFDGSRWKIPEDAPVPDYYPRGRPWHKEKK